MGFFDKIKIFNKVFGRQKVQEKEPSQEKTQGQFSANKIKASAQELDLPKANKGKEDRVSDLPQRAKSVVQKKSQTLSLSPKPTSIHVPTKHQKAAIPKPKSKPKKQLILGLDFGTAFTKAIIREQRVCYAVPFDAPGINNTYLLPGEMQIGHDERCMFGWEEGCFVVKDMKMKLLEGQDTHEDRVYTAAFMSMVMCHCRNWLMDEHKSTYKDFVLDWYVNIGLPTASYHDKELKEKYRLISLAGWALSLDDRLLTLPLAEAVYNEIELKLQSSTEDVVSYKLGMLHPEAIGLFPEFVAQIVGYVRSPLRKPDLHILMDVGAGTVDLSIFNVHENSEGEDSFPIFSKDVKSLGTQYLCRYRIQRAHKSVELAPKSSQKVPSKVAFARLLGVTLQKLAELDKPFEKRIRYQLNDQLTYTKEKRYPHSPHWNTGVPLFLCGGGSQVDLYSDIIASIEDKTNHRKRIRRELLPKPKDLKAPGLNADEYDRLSVAFGLSFDAFDIGQIIMSNEIDDDDDEPSPSSPM